MIEGREYKRKCDDSDVTGTDPPWGLPNHIIACNRPSEYNTLPVEFLHEAFGMFRGRCSTTPSERAFNFLNELTIPACDWYTDENERGSVIRSVFQEHLDIQFHAEKVPNTKFTTDGNFAVTVMPAAIRESQKETGIALSQAILYYSKFLLQALSDHRHFYNFYTTFPCVLMVDIGMSTI